MLLAGNLAVAAKELGTTFGIPALTTASTVPIFGSALLVSGAILPVAVRELRADRHRAVSVRDTVAPCDIVPITQTFCRLVP